MARPGKATHSAPVPGEVSRAPGSEAPGSGLLGADRGLDSRRELAQTETPPTLACLTQGVTVAIVHGVLLSGRQNVSGQGLQHHPVTALFPFKKGRK